MKIFTNVNKTSDMKGDPAMFNDHKPPMPPVHPVPPHERRAMLQIEFDDQDMALFQKAFGDEDTAAAAADILREAPPEIQVLALQLIDMMKEDH